MFVHCWHVGIDNCRIVEGESGSILVDGTDISMVALHELRSSLTVIPQVREVRNM